MLLGHGAIGQFGVAEALSGLVVNAGTVDVSMGQAATFSIGTETVAASAVFAVTTAGAGTFSLGTEVATGGATVSPSGNSITVSLGEETAFGEAFQTLITLSTGSPNLLIWNEVDDTEADSVTWSEVFED
jgi:hypothetical protein|tara:strand:- start:1176 stop:1565 length:390 start_codon:yes stop_codon:yes gene_type:complete